jgi:ribonuclease HII
VSVQVLLLCNLLTGIIFVFITNRPVVAAAAIVPINISGVIDSKKITKEEEREQLYEAIVASPGVRYAVAVVSAQRIDEINILQATLEGMRIATEAVMKLDQEGGDIVGEVNNHASADRTEISYVITGSTQANGEVGNQSKTNNYYALIDGNKVPKEMPCPAESMIQGDGREFAIAAASILAKVTRDRLMHEYDKKYPEYELSRHKGYPTAAHVSVALYFCASFLFASQLTVYVLCYKLAQMAIVKKIGASPIHRRTFAPLKYMKFDADGKIID